MVFNLELIIVNFSLAYLCGLVGDNGRTTILHYRVRGQYRPFQIKSSCRLSGVLSVHDYKVAFLPSPQVGEITFFDIAAKEDMATLYVSGYIDTLMVAHQTDSFTHLLVRWIVKGSWHAKELKMY